jgi:hypothetical protein
MPEAKIKQYSSRDQSLKFQVMAAMTTQNRAWEESEIDQHARAMKQILAEPLAAPHRA